MVVCVDPVLDPEESPKVYGEALRVAGVTRGEEEGLIVKVTIVVVFVVPPL
jgi:hypothetical protein